MLQVVVGVEVVGELGQRVGGGVSRNRNRNRNRSRGGGRGKVKIEVNIVKIEKAEVVVLGSHGVKGFGSGPWRRRRGVVHGMGRLPGRRERHRESKGKRKKKTDRTRSSGLIILSRRASAAEEWG